MSWQSAQDSEAQKSCVKEALLYVGGGALFSTSDAAFFSSSSSSDPRPRRPSLLLLLSLACSSQLNPHPSSLSSQKLKQLRRQGRRRLLNRSRRRSRARQPLFAFLPCRARPEREGSHGCAPGAGRRLLRSRMGDQQVRAEAEERRETRCVDGGARRHLTEKVGVTLRRLSSRWRGGLREPPLSLFPLLLCNDSPSVSHFNSRKVVQELLQARGFCFRDRG